MHIWNVNKKLFSRENKIYNNSGTVLFIVILLIIFLLIPYTFSKSQYVLSVNNNRSIVKEMLKDNEYYIKNKSNIKITKVTLSYGFDESLCIYQGYKKLHETYTGNSTTSDLEAYVRDNGYKTDKISDKLWIVSIVICVILTIISIIRCIKKLRIYIKKNKGKE